MNNLKFGKTGVSSKAYPIFGRIPNLRRYSAMLSSLRKFELSEIAQERLRIMEFYDRYGERAAKEAFGADRKLVYVWRKRLAKTRQLAGLIPNSTRPVTVRQMTTHPKIVAFVKALRKKRPRLGKEKIQPLLDKYCLRENIPTIAQSTIGKLIKRRNFFFNKQGKVYHNPASCWAKAKKVKRLRIKHSPKPQDFGHIQSDTVERINDGIKDYFYSAIDARLKFALTLNYPRLNSRNNKDFYLKFKSCYPGIIRKWQSDNGQENLGEFDQQLKQDQVTHIFSYPRCPKINAFIERYNRTVQEEFIDPNLHLIHDKITFNRQLADYIIFYNTQRVHKALENQSPMDYLIKKGLMSKKSVTYTKP
jgi:transposase InsO family protein